MLSLCKTRGSTILSFWVCHQCCHPGYRADFHQMLRKEVACYGQSDSFPVNHRDRVHDHDFGLHFSIPFGLTGTGTRLRADSEQSSPQYHFFGLLPEDSG